MTQTILNQALEAVMDIINGMGLFSPIRRGALGTDDGLCCEIGPTSPEIVFLDKNKYIPIDMTINGKNKNIETLTEAMNGIHERLTMMREYPFGDNWEIVDITAYTDPRMVAREDSGQWLFASSLHVKVRTI